LVDVEGLHRQAVTMAAARRVLPRILKIQALPGVAFDLDAGDDEVELAGRNGDHASRRAGDRLRRSDLNHLLRQRVPHLGERLQRDLVEVLHLLQECVEAFDLRTALHAQDGAVAASLQL
jgi:hypothetical protein